MHNLAVTFYSYSRVAKSRKVAYFFNRLEAVSYGMSYVAINIVYDDICVLYQIYIFNIKIFIVYII